ncbi:MAG TPA: hypothetical protein VGL83_15115 [Stellaceae bacterium]|jgi:hypothetical protein
MPDLKVRHLPILAFLNGKMTWREMVAEVDRPISGSRILELAALGGVPAELALNLPDARMGDPGEPAAISAVAAQPAPNDLAE